MKGNPQVMNFLEAIVLVHWLVSRAWYYIQAIKAYSPKITCLSTIKKKKKRGICLLLSYLIKSYFYVAQSVWGCLVYVFKQQFSVFKQYFTHFNALFHPHVFPQMFLNNNFQFLNTHTKRALNILFLSVFPLFGLGFWPFNFLLTHYMMVEGLLVFNE